MDGITSRMGSMGLGVGRQPVIASRSRGLSALPKELLDKIIEALPGYTYPLEGGPSTIGLREDCSSLSLTCSSLAASAQRVQLSNIRVPTSRCREFVDCMEAGEDLSHNVRWLTLVVGSYKPTDLAHLRQISLICGNVDVVKVELVKWLRGAISIASRDYLRDFLGNPRIRSLAVNSFVARRANILPSQPLEQLMLDFSTPDEEERFTDDYLSAPLQPLQARWITLRDLEAWASSEGQEGWLKEFFAVLGQPTEFKLDRSGMHTDVLVSALETDLARGLVTLTLDQVGLHRYPGASSSLKGLAKLRELRIGVIGSHLMSDSPPNLKSLTLLYVNTPGATSFLLSITSGPLEYSSLPPACNISFYGSLADPVQDGSSFILDPGTSLGRKAILDQARYVDKWSLQDRRAQVKCGFEAAAITALSHWPRVVQEEVDLITF